MLLDGNSLAYRAFFALPTEMATASGQVTNAVFGFTSMLVNLVREHRPEHVAVTFDRPEPTFRHERVPHYKANRDKTPDILVQQLGLVRQVVQVLGLPVVEVSGVEADDVLATLAEQAAAGGDDALIVTGDRDSYQLVRDPHIKVLYNRRGVSDYAIYDEKGILERTGVSPVQYVQYAAMRGDPSDNLPGVPGVGEKTAARLLTKYGSLDGIFEHLAEQTPKLRENLAAHEETVRLNAEVMALVRDVAEVPPLASLDQQPVDADGLRRLIDFLEFGSLEGRLREAFDVGGDDAEAATARAELTVQLQSLTDPADAAQRLETLQGTKHPCAVDAVLASGLGEVRLHTLVVAAPTEAEVLAIDAALLVDAGVREALVALMGTSGPGIWAHGAKPILRALLHVGVDARHLVVDTRLAAYLLDPSDGAYDLLDLLARYTSLSVPAASAVEVGRFDFDGDQQDPRQAAAVRAAAVLAVAPSLLEAVDAQGMRSLLCDVEVPLVRVLAKMERAGVGVDRGVLEELGHELAEQCTALRASICAHAGRDLNVNSTQQLGVVLFEELGLPPQKKTKTGYSTDAATLEKLRGQHPIIDELLEYRELEKLRSTYAEGLLAEVAPDGRIHATFHQTVARTGRLSSDAPNLHNIPVRSDRGRRFREVFVAAPDHELLVADYDQIELRCIAHLAEDPGLIEAFESGVDIHAQTASRIFDVSPGDVTIEQRSKAKMVSYGLAYGMEAYGLAQRLSIPTSEAAAILDAYFVAFPAVHDYMARAVAEATDRGYTETLFGRRRRIPELASTNHRLRQAGERQAMNAGIQGLAADIFKVALVRLDEAIEEAEAQSRLILQVHDEVLVEVAASEWEATEAAVRAAMTGAYDLRVPLAVQLARGPTWAAAKG